MIIIPIKDHCGVPLDSYRLVDVDSVKPIVIAGGLQA